MPRNSSGISGLTPRDKGTQEDAHEFLRILVALMGDDSKETLS